MPFDQLGLSKQVKSEIEQKLLLLDPTTSNNQVLTIQYSSDQSGEAQKRLALAPELLMLVAIDHSLSHFYMCHSCRQVSLTRDAFLSPQNHMGSCSHSQLVRIEQIGYKCLPCWNLWNSMNNGEQMMSQNLQQCCMFASLNEYLEHAVKYGHMSMANLLLMKRKEEMMMEQQQQNAMSTFLQAMAASVNQQQPQQQQAKVTIDNNKKFKY